ncbi:YrdB family protein [Nocardia sp. CA2R105]|uniref:YrdB family protein n=1 Tax=Nocardia coffeae TaxID=2873381 RepID=UPI001CA7813C|nr:YrdB family protein [Nocardia coffeae]MBY8860360.1 YrdB family protein [Nocardia coffeae]
MQEVWKWANLTLAFVMELVALAALALWGWKTATATPIKLVLAVGAPLLAALAWGLFAAPNATFHYPLLAGVTKVVVFGGAAVGLWAVGYRAAAVVFVAILVANLLAIRLGHLTS